MIRTNPPFEHTTFGIAFIGIVCECLADAPGCDLVSLLHPSEFADCASRAHPCHSAAARIAARQALTRALIFDSQEIAPVTADLAWICSDVLRRPYFQFAPDFAETHLLNQADVSLSHVIGLSARMD